MRSIFICLAIAFLISAPLAAQTERDAAAFTASPRRAADPAPPGPPELSAAADNMAALTLEQRTESPGAIRRTVSRTANRIHIAYDDGREWLFVRNPVDGRRAMGYLVEHARKRISTYAESDLRNAVGIRGWADLLTEFAPEAGSSTRRWIVDRIREGVDESLLQLPTMRFPDYAEASYADWLEDR